jgi:hypothetical protein
MFLVDREAWHRDTIHVAKFYTVKDGPFLGNKADIYLEYAAFGELDSALRFTSVAPVGTIVRENFRLLFDNRYSLPARGNVPAQEFIGPNRWRIVDAPREQWLTVDAAIRYVQRMRDITLDPGITENAEETLDNLSRYR